MRKGRERRNQKKNDVQAKKGETRRYMRKRQGMKKPREEGEKARKR